VAFKLQIHLAPWLHALLASLAVTFISTAISAVMASDPARILELATWVGALKLGLGTVVVALLGFLLNKVKALDPKSAPPAAAPTPPAGSAPLAVLLALLAVSGGVLASCSPRAASGATISVMALGDTARISFHWPAVTKATGYTYTITAIATNGTWTGLPTAAVTASTSGTALATSATADTAVFQLCATATGPAGSSAVGCSTGVANAGNTWRRKLGTPQPVLDSVTVSIVPNPVNVTLAAARIVCAFPGFKDGQVGERTADKAACDSLYQGYFLTSTRHPTAPEQAFADSATWGWSTANPAAVGLVQQGLGSSAVLVQGNALTLLGPFLPLARYAGTDWPVYRIDSTYVGADGLAHAAITCLRPGRATLVATAGDARTEFPVVCEPHPWEVRLAADVLLVRRT
jgi:hypothetical protein